MAVLGLRFCARAFSSCGKRGPLFIAVRGPLIITASLVVEHSLQTRRLSSCGSRAQLLRGMWDLPRPGFEPMSPALAGRFSTTAPPGKPYIRFLLWPLNSKNRLNILLVLKKCTQNSKGRKSHQLQEVTPNLWRKSKIPLYTFFVFPPSVDIGLRLMLYELLLTG